jgi:hypothetical protein
MFTRNLNLFLPYCWLISQVLGKPLGAIALPVALSVWPTDTSIYISSIVGHGVPLLLVAFAWWKFGLAPKAYKPTGEHRAKTGHWIIAIANTLLLVIGALGLSLMYAMRATGNIPFLLLLASPVILIAWIVGLVLIWSAYAPA